VAAVTGSPEAAKGVAAINRSRITAMPRGLRPVGGEREPSRAEEPSWRTRPENAGARCHADQPVETGLRGMSGIVIRRPRAGRHLWPPRKPWGRSEEPWEGGQAHTGLMATSSNLVRDRGPSEPVPRQSDRASCGRSGGRRQSHSRRIRLLPGPAKELLQPQRAGCSRPTERSAMRTIGTYNCSDRPG
jgi:hypothetical protein